MRAILSSLHVSSLDKRQASMNDLLQWIVFVEVGFGPNSEIGCHLKISVI